jgi:hypothetical protein
VANGWGEGVAAVDVEVGVDEWGQPGDVGVERRVAVGAELGEGGVGVAGVPQHDDVQDQAQDAELVFLAFAVALAELSALAVEDGVPVRTLSPAPNCGDLASCGCC